jgi:hypothetical protein
MKIPMKTALFLGVCAMTTLASVEALADDKAVCLDAASQGQTLRDAHRLVEARNQFLVCARQECPSVVRKDCTTWVEQAQSSLPTVVPLATDAAGGSLPGVKVSMDGKVLLDKADGRAVEVNPGTHTFTFETADGTKIDLQVVVAEGQKNERVAATIGKPQKAAMALPPPPAFTSAAPTPAAPPAPASTSAERAPGESSSGPWKALGIVTTGVGVVGLGIGTVFGVQASNKKSSAGCTSNSVCPTQPDLDTLHDAHNAGNLSTVFFAVGGALAAAGITMWAIAPRAPVNVAPSMSGNTAVLNVQGTW